MTEQLKQCVCPSGVTRAECISFRYTTPDDAEWCECVCHDADDEEQRRWYEEQAADKGDR